MLPTAHIFYNMYHALDMQMQDAVVVTLDQRCFSLVPRLCHLCVFSLYFFFLFVSPCIRCKLRNVVGTVLSREVMVRGGKFFFFALLFFFSSCRRFNHIQKTILNWMILYIQMDNCMKWNEMFFFFLNFSWNFQLSIRSIKFRCMMNM